MSKLDSAGNFVFATTVFGFGANSGNGIVVDGVGNSYVTGSVGDNTFVTKRDATGNELYLQELVAANADSGSLGNGIALDPSGNVYVTGSFVGTVDFDPSDTGTFELTSFGSGVTDNDNAFVLKLDSAGDFVYARQLGGADGAEGISIAADAAGNAYTVGEFFVTGDFDPGPGTSTLTSVSSGDVFVSKLTPSAGPLPCSLVVDTTSDADNAGDGVTSLREAINCANSDTDSDTITFAIPGVGPHTIDVGSTGLGALPTIINPVVINGQSQSLASCNTGAPGFATNAVLKIELNGTGAGAGANGLTITAGSSTVRGLAINRFGGSGIRLETGGSNTIDCNYIGLDVSGVNALQNVADGVTVMNSANNTIGGSADASRNVISGNEESGAFISGAGSTGNRVLGNFIGPNAAGTATPVITTGGAQNEGVNIDSGAANNTIGGTSAGARNVIAGHFDGVLLVGVGTTGNVIQGNFIGTDRTGAAILLNSIGVQILNAAGNTIGGLTDTPGTGAGNVIAGSTFEGISLSQSTLFGGTSDDNVIAGNLIGTNAAGTAGLPNNTGMFVTGTAANNTIGGADPRAGNVISGNNFNGVVLNSIGAAGHLLQNNFFGTDITGLLALGNGNSGISVNTSNHTIRDNTIASNGGAGVIVTGGTGNAIRSNSMFDNSFLGITLAGAEGSAPPTLNDPGDVDMGSNDRLNFPVLETATTQGSSLVLTGFARPGSIIEFFIADPDPTGFGEGHTFIITHTEGSADDTDATTGTYGPGAVNGLSQGTDTTNRFRFSVPAASLLAPVAVGAVLTSTATDASNNASEFSGNVTVVPCRLVVDTTSDADDAGDGVTSLREAINCANSDTDLDTITFSIPGTGVHTIDVGGTGLGGLPEIIQPVVIDGESQLDANCNTNGTGLGSNADLRIELNGAAAGASANGITITAGGSTVRGLVINRFPANGILLQIGNGNLAECNYIGTDEAGVLNRGNSSDGILVLNSSINTIGGIAAAARNVISGNGANGVRFAGFAEFPGAEPVANLMLGNFLGVDSTGGTSLGNSESGVLIGPDARGNTIGGITATARNIISGNQASGVVIQGAGATLNTVQGNFIGTDVTGTLDRGNGDDGVSIEDATNNTIGGTTVAARNLISGNDDQGVAINGSGTTGNLVQGNFIGTNAAGTAALGNGDNGVRLTLSAASNTIGGVTAGARNIISGNGDDGVRISDGATLNVVLGNFIGTNAAGSAAVPNASQGVTIQMSPSNTIGGTAAGAGNVISGNGAEGVRIEGAESQGNLMLGNFIGTNAAGAMLGNGSHGVLAIGSGPNQIGGTVAGAGNTIAFNGGDGVAVVFVAPTSFFKFIRQNSIFDNVGLGIDLEDDGVTPNDPGDIDTGANDHFNFPVFESASISGSNLIVAGFARPGTEIELLIADPDPTGFGEGVTFLTTLIEGSGADTDTGAGSYPPPSGQGSDTTNRFRFTVPLSSLPAAVSGGTILTATGTDASTNTSEFSGNITVQGQMFDFGDAANTYATLLSSNGPRHALGSGLAFFCGADGAPAVDADADGQPSTFADGDDLDADGFDEEGVQLSPLTPGTTGSVTICATAAGRLDAFIDFNDDGDFADAGEKVFDNVAVLSGTDILTFGVPAAATGGSNGVTFSRFRISTAGGLSFTGSAADGEVEDHSVDIFASDFGDAPASYGNPSHQVRFGPILGDDIDTEPAAQPNATATGDDTSGTPDDEDGVTFVGSIRAGFTANVNVEVSFNDQMRGNGTGRSASLDGFVDFNADGDFNDPGEEVFDGLTVFEGTNQLSFPVPFDADTGFTFARFRVSSEQNLLPDGPAGDGEVEDYRIRIIGGEGGCEDFALDVPETGEGNVKARVSGGILKVRGDALGNGLVIEAGDGPGSYQISSLGGTTINRQFGTQLFVGATRGIQVGLLGGPDILVLDGTSAELAVLGKLRIRSGTSSVAIIDRALSLFDDHDTIAIVDALLESGLTVKLRRDADDLALCGVEALHRVRTGEGLGPDLLTVDDSTFDSRYNSGVSVGQDVISIEQHGNPDGPSTEFNGHKTKLRGRKGNDAICIGIPGEPGNSANFHGRTKIKGGRGRHDSLDGLDTGANSFDSPPIVIGIEQVDAGNPACGLIE